MHWREINVLIVEDQETLRLGLSTALECDRIIKWQNIHGVWTYTESEEKIKDLVKQWIQELILILDWEFLYSPEELKPQYIWRELLKFIMKEFWPKFILYLIPFSNDLDTSNYMVSENQNNSRIRILEGTRHKSADEVIIAIHSIDKSKEISQEEIDSSADYFFEILLANKWWTDDFKPHTSIADCQLIREKADCTMKEAKLIRNTMIQRHVRDILAMDIKINWKTEVHPEDLDVEWSLISLSL